MSKIIKRQQVSEKNLGQVIGGCGEPPFAPPPPPPQPPYSSAMAIGEYSLILAKLQIEEISRHRQETGEYARIEAHMHSRSAAEPISVEFQNISISTKTNPVSIQLKTR